MDGSVTDSADGAMRDGAAAEAAASAAVGSMVMSRLSVNSHDNNFVFTSNATLHIVIPAKIRPIRRYSDRFLILRGSSFVRRIDAVLSSFSAMTVARCQKVYFFVSQSRHCT